jgi:ElaA protein
MYRILQLRTDVFVVEQNCPYPELDGRDLEPDAVWVWVTESADSKEAGQVTATLRILRDEDGQARIGRVATAKSARSGGIASKMMEYALDEIARWGKGIDVILDAQSYLEDWYGRFGFVRSGKDFLDDGIPHVPMTRPSN